MRRSSLALGLALLALPALRPAAAQVAPGTVLDGVIAVVDDGVILRSDVEAVAAQFARGAAVTDAIRRTALDALIGERVFAVHARRDTTITVTEEQVTQQVDTRIEELTRQLGGADRLAATFGRPIEAIRANLREDVRRQLLAQQFQGRRLRDVRVTPQEVRTFFDAIPAAERPEIPALVRVAHVVRKPAPDEGAEARARDFAGTIRDSVLAGVDMGDLARRHSTDEGSRNNGGRYDGFNLRELVSEFAAALSALEPGGLSGVFRTEFGYHVARLESRRGDIVAFTHVLIPVDDTTVDPAPLLAELASLRDSVVTHATPFEAVARRHSEDPYSATRGGYVQDPQTGERDLRVEALGPLWQAVLDTMEVGEISAPAPVQLLDGSNAFHIVLLQRRTPPHPLSVETDYALLSEYALQQKRATVREQWLQELRQTVFVEVRDPNLASN